MSMIEYNESDGVCLLRLTAPPVNALSFELLEQLKTVIERANADGGVARIVIIGDAHHFSAGADIKLLKDVTSAEEAIRISSLFHEVFACIEDSSKPVIAALSGKVMGGAAELAMACHFRVCTDRTSFSMPEVKLGINPGAGGTQRLPRLIGVGAALQMMLTAGPVRADKALAMGLVDAVCECRDLVETARHLALPAGPLPRTRNLTDKIGDAAVNDAAFAEAEQIVAGGLPELIAPGQILAAVKSGLPDSFEAGVRAEQEAFAACLDTLATRNKMYVFFAVRGTAKLQELANAGPARIGRAAVVGMGSMGTGIAHAMIIAGVPVTVLDQDEETVQRGLARIESSIRKRVEQGKLAEERAAAMLGLIRTASRPEDLSDSDLIIEAVFEDVEAKRAVLGSIEQACRDDAIIASNTSTISLDVLAEGMQHPERLVGLHFFNPAQRMPLVEVIRRESTPTAIAATAMAFAKSIRKTPVLVRNREGFAVNRLVIPYLNEAFRLLEDGADPRAVDRAMVDFGFPMGPLTLIDMAGIDILAATVDFLGRAFPRHGKLSPVAGVLVEEGCFGQKTGAGVYMYEKGNRKPQDSDVTARIIREVRERNRDPSIGANDDEIVDRLVLGMVNDAFHVMQEGVVAREVDMDAATVLGMGFPDFRGGVLKYARYRGLGEIRARLAELAERYGERFAPCM